MDFKDYSKYFMLILFVGILTLSLFIIKDFLVPIITGLIVGYIFLPIYRRINKIIKNKNVSALFLSLVLILLIVMPSIFLLNAVVKESSTIYTMTKQKLSSKEFIDCTEPNLLCKIMNFFIEDSTTKTKVIYYVDEGVKGITGSIIEGATGFVFSIPRRILDLFITLFLIFYVFVDGNRLFKCAEKLFPIRQKHRAKLLKQFSDVTYALVYGTILVGIMEGTILGIGFFLSGIASPILWGVLTAFLALIPLMGPTLIWVPAFFIQLYTGHYLSALGVLIIGALVSIIDTVLRPKIIGNKANVHPVLVLLGVLGGIQIFGFIGVIFGPLVLAFISTFILIYEKEIHGDDNKIKNKKC